MPVVEWESWQFQGESKPVQTKGVERHSAEALLHKLGPGMFMNFA